jgi:hypothetical protein
MAAQGDHVDCARLLMYYKAPVDDVTVVSFHPCSITTCADPKVHERYCRVLQFCLLECTMKQGTI